MQAAPRIQPSRPCPDRVFWPGPPLEPAAHAPLPLAAPLAADLADECTLVMILLFQINPSASESALAVDHMRSFFECVLQDYYHHDVRTISAMMLERIADARQHGGGLSLPPESLFSLASRIEEQLASAKQCTPGGARTPGWQAGCQAGLLLTRVRRAWDIRSADRHGVPAGQGRGLSRAVQPGAAGAAEQFGEMQVVGGDASRPAQPDPRLLLATFNQQTAGVCHPTEASNHPTATSPATATSTLDYID